MKFIGELLPIDGFRVSLNVSLPQHYRKSLHHLYQPLLGIEAINLYELLLNEAKLMATLSLEKQTHHTLMNQLNVSLDVIYKARLKLEAIGLLQTFKHESEYEKIFTYEIIPPFSPEEFFADFMLCELLERQVGKRRYEQLKLYYIKNKQTELGENITAAFHEVFQTFVPKEISSTPQEVVHKKPNMALLPVDFNVLASSLKKRNIPVPRVLTEMNRRIITQLNNLYDLESYELEKALLWALTDEYALDIEQFKAACHDFFVAKQNVSTVKLTLKTESERKEGEKQHAAQHSKLDQLINRLENITPKQLLEDLSGGNNASEQDLKMIREIMVQQGLPTPVMNVLIHFTLLKTNMQLSRPYMEKIASHWSRAKLKTAKEAMEFALQQSSQPKQQTKRNYNSTSRPRKQEVIPDWFKERNVKKVDQKDSSPTEEELKAQEEMAAILKKYNSN